MRHVTPLFTLSVLPFITIDSPFAVVVKQEYPFRDLKGSWHVRIQLSPTSVIISHIKRERSHEEPGSDYFEFSWLLSVFFDAKVENFHTEVKIIDYFWSDTIKEETKLALREAWYPFVSLPKKLPPIPLETPRLQISASDIIRDVCAAINQYNPHSPLTFVVSSFSPTLFLIVPPFLLK